MAGYALEKKPFVEDAPSVGELAEVLQIKQQHWNPIAREMHERWPDLWCGPSEIDEASFYECLVASFRHDANGTRQTLLRVASSKRSHKWQRLLDLPKRAFGNGMHVLQIADPESAEEIYAALRDRQILYSLQALTDSLANVGKPAFGRVMTWLIPLYPELTTDPAEQNDPPGPDPDLYGAALSETRQDWGGIVADMQEALHQAQADPFNERPLQILAAALEELWSLAEVHRDTLAQEYRDSIEIASAACARVREAWADAAPPFVDLLKIAERVLAGQIETMKPAAVVSFASALEGQVQLALSARAKIGDAKQAIMDAATADRDTEITVLLEQKQASQAALSNAETAIADALRSFAEAAGAKGARVDAGAAIPDPTATETSDDDLEQQETTGEVLDTQTKSVATSGDSLVTKDQASHAASQRALPGDGDLRQPERLPLEGPEVSAVAEYGADGDPSAPTAGNGEATNERTAQNGDSARMGRGEGAGAISVPPADKTPTAQTPNALNTPIQLAPLGHLGNRVSDEALFVFDAFCENRWIGPDGRCQRAPWINADFDEQLRAASKEALVELRLAHLEVFSRALEARGQMALVAADDLRAMVEILTHPASDSAGGADDPRLPRLLAAAEEGAAKDQVLIGALLETLKPSDEAPPTDADRQAILDAADINSTDLRILLERLLTFRQHGDDGWGKLLKQYQGDETLSDADVSQQLAEARERFQRRVQQLWSAAAGKIQRTHCRKAWTQFVETHVHPLVPVLAPCEHADDFTGWNIGKLTSQVRKLPVRHAKIADRGGAKLADRRMMDKAAAEIADLAADVLRLAQLHSKRSALPSFHGLELPLRELRALMTGGPLADAAEELCRLGIQALVNRQPVLEASGITDADRWRLPDLLPMLNIDGDPDGRRWTPVLPVSAIAPPNIVGAAALLMHPGDPMPPTGNLPHALRSRLIETGRSDLLPYLIGSGDFPTEEKTRIQREFNERIEALNQQLRRLDSLRLEATALALPCAANVDRAHDSARSLLEERERVLRELPLIASWLDTLISEVSEEVGRNVARLRREAERIASAEQRIGVLAHIEAGRFDRALEGLRDKGALAHSEEDAVRQTVWRREARQRFPEPFNTLQAAAQDAELGELPALWLRQRRSEDKQAQTKLRRTFYDFVSSEGELSATRKRRIVPKEFREIRGAQIAINCGELLKLLGKEGLNPTFVPQLRDFSELVIASPPFGLTPNNAPNQLSRYIAGERDSRKLVVFLMPGLHEPVRERILAELRGRELRSAGAVLDDLDLCRLIGHDATQRPHGMLGLIEIVFEQLSWKDLSPYVSRDGQFIQLEMFVGREREAEKLALTAEYTRVFSGRKLGKSALLKYVEQTYSGTSLPSDNELHVLYIIVAGGESENWLTDKVVAEIRARFPSAPDVPDESDPGLRLEKFLEGFFHEHKHVSLLVILDEADAFVEGQLKEYDRLRERCLSFRMMKTTFGGVDKNNLPRVRFVFSGYRVTNSRAGAWANAGSVLRLAPLTEEDSINLAIGPLARLGIDATEQAATIARYCGFQPAIIIRFCDALLKHVQLTRAASGRREVTITYEDVVNTFHQATVQEEIRTINDNNFQGNRVGRIVFWTMLLAFNDLLSGQGLENAPKELLERIRALDPDTAWLRKLDPSETGEILRNLHDFRNRELIEESQQEGNPVYRMKFPAHLPVLMTEEDPEHQIRQDIQRVREGGNEAHFVTSLLTPKQIDDLHFALSEEGAEMGVSMAVAASPWLGALQDDRGGVVDRLGYRGDDVVAGVALSAAQHDQPTLLIHDAKATVAERLMRERDKGLRPPLLIGGLDVMRWALRQSLTESGAMVSYVGLKRLDEARLTWWYERLRNVHFDSQDAIARILDLTSGVPMLLAAWEALMPRQAEISREQFGAVCDAFEQQLPQLAQQLSSDDPCVALTDRELELLRMAVRLGQESNDTFQLRDELVDGWGTWGSLLGGDIADARPLFAAEEDEAAVTLLIESGFIPVTGRGEVVFLPNDAIYRLLAGDA